MLKKEWQAIFKHKFFIIVIIALSLVPAIYNYIFLGSMWDPYGNLKDLPVAVVNLDKASELDGKKLELGDKVISEMKKSKDLDYHFVSKTDAKNGIKKGDYYMVITFPKNFSENAASLMSENPKVVQLDYQTSRGHNYISSKMSESAVTQLKAKVSEKVTKDYTEAIFDKIAEMKPGMHDASDGAKKLADGSQTALSGSSEISKNLDTLASSSLTFTDGANTLNVGVDKYVDGVKQAALGSEKLADGTKQFSAGAEQLAEGTQTLADKSKKLSAGITKISQSSESAGQLQSASQQLADGLTKLSAATSLSDEDKANFTKLETGLTDLNQQIQAGSTDSTVATQVENDLKNVQAVLPKIIQDQVTASTTAISATDTFKNLTSAQQADLLNALKNSADNSTEIQADSQSISDSLTDVGNQLKNLQTQTQMLANGAAQILPAASQTINQLSTGINNAHIALSNQILPGTNQLAGGIAQFNIALTSGGQQLTSGFNQFAAGVNQANDGAHQLADKSKDIQTGSLQLVSGLTQLQGNSQSLSSGSVQLADGAKQIASGSSQLADGSQTLTKGLDSLNNGAGTLSSALTDADKKLSATNSNKKNADKIATPLKTKHTDHDNVPVNGEGMTPYMICVALFIGALATNVVIGHSFSGEKWKSGREFMWAKIGTNGLVALLQALIVYGAVVALGLRANYNLRMLLSVILISFAFMAINTFFLTWLGKVGEFVMIVFLVLQLATSAGTYPLQLAPHIFQVISPWLPMTYGLRMLRETIGLGGNILPYVLLFGVIILIFTGELSFFKKISRFA